MPGSSPFAWGFHPIAAGAGDRDEERRWRDRLEAAARTGHGLDVRLRLTVGRRAAPELRAEADDPRTRAWFERTFTSVYPPGNWRRAPAVLRSPSQVRWVARRRRLPGELGAALPEPGTLLQALRMALGTAPRGAALTIAVEPVVPNRLGRLVDWFVPPASPPDSKSATRRRSPSAPPPPDPVPPRELLWRVAMQFEGGSRDDPADAGGFAAASTVLDGEGFRWVRAAGDAPGQILLNTPELLALLPVPGGPESEAPLGPGGIPLGHTAAGAVVEHAVEPGQGRHLMLVGETGMGKSSLEVAFAARAASSARLLLLDPLGETAGAVRRELDRRRLPYSWIAPGAVGVGINALGSAGRALGVDPVRGEREISALVQTFRRVRAGRYAEGPFWGPRLEEMLGRALRAAASVPGGTLEDAHAMLARADDGRGLVPPGASAAWRDLAARVRARPEDAEGARRLLFEVVRDPTLVALLASRSPSFDFGELLGSSSAVLFAGSAGTVGESTARYLLSTYLALLWSELLADRAPRKTFVVLDEVQWFAHEGLTEMLRLSRRLNVHLVLATQSLESLPEEVAESARTNVADWVLFRGGAGGLRDLLRGLPTVRPELVGSLPRGEALLLTGKGERVRWAKAARLPLDLTVPPDGRPHGAPPAGRPAAPPGSEIPGVPALLAWAQAHPPAGTGSRRLEVPLRELRSGAGFSEAAIRALGGELGRRGALVARRRDPNGPTWIVDPERLDASPPAGSSPPSSSTPTKPL